MAIFQFCNLLNKNESPYFTSFETVSIYLRAFTIFVNKETLTSIFTTSKVIKVSKPKKIEPVDLGKNDIPLEKPLNMVIEHVNV